MQLDAPVNSPTAEDALMRMMLAAGRRLRAKLDGDSIEPSQISLLFCLKTRGAMRLGDIAEAMKLDASTVSRHVQQLADRGMLDREPDPDDGRARIIALSSTGRAGLKKSFEQRRAYLAEVLTDWSADDREQLRTMLDRLTTSLGDHS